MKKQYIRPEMMIIEIAPCCMLSTSVDIYTESQGDFKKDFVRGHRGTWGNLWDKMNEKDT